MIDEFLVEAARDLAQSLSDDIMQCKTREEHIRVTTRANAAAALYNGLVTFHEDKENR